MARGSFQAIHTVLVDGPDFQALTPAAKLVWFTLKLTLGASGIDTVAALVPTLVERTGCPEDVVAGALEELQPDWVRIERNIVWLVDGLRHNPNLKPTHAVHRRSVQQHIAGLPRLGIVGEFVSYYAPMGWFPVDEWGSEAYPEAQPSLSLATDRAHASHARGSLITSYFLLGSKDLGSKGRDPDKGRAKPPEEPEGFAVAWAAYPKRSGGNPRKAALRTYRARLAAGAEPDELLAGVERYAAYVRAAGNERTQFVMQAATFFGPDDRWREPWDPPPAKKPRPGTPEWEDEQLEARARVAIEETEKSTAWLRDRQAVAQ